MTDEEEEKMKKMRVRIERDAYSVLLSFKDGASPKQVETRMEETLGYTYHNKYYQAGVYDMSQILREHPQVRVGFDGKFKIIANEDNRDLVALISKQKENKKKRGGQKGRRPMTSIGHHRNSFAGGLQMRTSPKTTTGFRPLSSVSRPLTQRPNSSVPAGVRSYTPHFRPPSTVKYGGANLNVRPNLTGFAQNKGSVAVKTQTLAPSVQRPLIRPSTSSSISTNSITQTNSLSTVRNPSPPRNLQQAAYMPSIKEFTDNAKHMMLKLHPSSVHLSEMTERYSQEYGVTVEPLQLFSKSWMLLVKTTFKECFQINDGNVSIKEEWLKKYGAAFKKQSVARVALVPSVAPKQTSAIVSVASAAASFTSAVKAMPLVPNDSSAQSIDIRLTLPTNQGFRYQIPQQKSPTESVNQKMKGLTVGTRRNALTSPEKPPGIPEKSRTKEANMAMKSYFPKNQFVGTKIQPTSSNQEMSRKPVLSDPKYDAKHLRVLKFVEKGGELKNSVDAALNEIPEIRKAKKSPKASVRGNKTLPITSSSNFLVENTAMSSSEFTCTQPVTPANSHRSQSRVNQSSALSSRILGRALADIHKQNDMMLSSKCTNYDQKSLYVTPTTATPTSAQVEKKVQTQRVPNGRKLLLPPMSKGAHSKHQIRSRPVSCSRSVNSQDATIERAMNATLPIDDEQW